MIDAEAGQCELECSSSYYVLVQMIRDKLGAHQPLNHRTIPTDSVLT